MVRTGRGRLKAVFGYGLLGRLLERMADLVHLGVRQILFIINSFQMHTMILDRNLAHEAL